MAENYPDVFSPLGMYGDREVFFRMLEAGFTRVAFGSGAWVNASRIVAI